MKNRTLVLAIAASLSLNACIPVIATGVGVSVAATVDRRTYGNQIEDGSIETRLNSRIANKLGPSAHVSATSYNRVVLISGEVPSEGAKQEAADQIATLPNEIRSVHNELVIGPRASISRQSEDTFITSKVKARLLESRTVAGHHVKVITESGTVFLMGVLTQPESEAAAAIAATTTGVRKVVKLFEIVSPEQIQKLDNPAGKSGK